uniref:ABC transporter permease n=1 Tax=Felis catus TaxID=9685 RepID=A0ABI7YSX3_FELCA
VDLLTFNQFAVLLWKNFTLKRRHFFNLILEVLSVLVFPTMILVFSTIINIKAVGPYNFISQPINTLPPFFINPGDWELIYVPSNINLVNDIAENVKRNLNISVRLEIKIFCKTY